MKTKKVLLVGGPAAGTIMHIDAYQNYLHVETTKNGMTADETRRHAYMVRKEVLLPASTLLDPVWLATADGIIVDPMTLLLNEYARLAQHGTKGAL